jgi:maltose phosphorylase
MDKALELYLRTSRLDLDDYNHEADEGLHITSMAGTWMSVVEGLAGVRVTGTGLSIHPNIPKPWKAYSFQIRYQNQPLAIAISQHKVAITNLGSALISCELSGVTIQIEAGATHEAALK